MSPWVFLKNARNSVNTIKWAQEVMGIQTFTLRFSLIIFPHILNCLMLFIFHKLFLTGFLDPERKVQIEKNKLWKVAEAQQISLFSKRKKKKEAAEGCGKCQTRGEEKTSCIYVLKLFFSPQTMECCCVPVPPLGAHITSALQGQTLLSPVVKLCADLKACCCSSLFFLVIFSM